MSNIRGSGNHFIFPSNLERMYEDYMKIVSYDYISYDSGGSTETPIKNAGTSVDPKKDVSTEDSLIDRIRYKRQATGNATARFIKDKKNTFYIPMPDTISFSDGQSWEAQNAGAMGLFAGELIKNMVGKNSGEVAASIQALAEAGLSGAALAAINSATDNKANFITQQSASKVINPYREQVFNGMQMRSFSFNYKFVPDNKDDQDLLKRLIRQLREDALPATSASNNILEAFENDGTEVNAEEGAKEDLESSLQDRWFDVPRVFLIEFMTINNQTNTVSRNASIPRMKPLICTGVNVDYTPEGVWATRVDSSPLATQLALSFEEIEIVVAQDIKEGY